MIDWKKCREMTTREERECLRDISRRYIEILKKSGCRPGKRIDVEMSMTACHCLGAKLDLGSLVTSSDFDFLHDVGGIIANIDHDNGSLKNFFWPRFASKTGERND